VIANRLAALGIAAAVQPLGVDADVFHPHHRAPDLRSELELAPDTRLLVFAGRMGREKQVDRLIAAVTRLGAPYHLLLIGGERRARIAPQVTVLPYEADSARLARLLGGADALVHAGVHETFGLVVLEAMACGLPAIGVNAGAVAELIDDAVGVLAPDARVDTLCDSIVHLYTQDLGAIGRAARARVEREYTWDRTFAALLEHYRRARREAPAGEAATTKSAQPAADAP
jgi:alpha-1,6-mannosyltransferase